MSPGGYSAHLASLKPALAPRPPADYLRLYASTSDVVLAHREKLTAGVPGCTCGKSYPEGSYRHSAVLHSQHVADEVVTHVLAATVAAIHSDLAAFARTPERWSVGSHDSLAAIDTITAMARLESEQARQEEPAT